MIRVLRNAIIVIILIISLILIALPTILTSFGLHPEYKEGVFVLNDKRALIIATNHGVLNKPNETNGKATGLFLSELSVPYFRFVESGITVDIASIKGGKIPLEPLPYFIKANEDKEFLKNNDLMSKLNNSVSIEDINFEEYDIVLLSGGWGAAYDLGFSDLLGEKISLAYYSEKKPIIGGICHGVLGFIKAKDRNNNLLIKGRKMTGVTDKQIKELGIDITPQHPETELKKAGVIFQSQTKFRDAFANLTVVDDEKRFVTGQNQNAGNETSYKIMQILSNRTN